jgi:Ca2+-binding RTX toxin-like protein
MAVLTYAASNLNSDAFESFFLPPARSDVFTDTAATVIVGRGGFFNGEAKFEYVLTAGTTNAVRVHSFTLSAPSAPFNNPTLLVSFDADPNGNGSIALNRSLATLHQGGAASAAALLAGNDSITSQGTVGRVLNGYAGDDVIKAGSGKDRIDGGTGKDALYGGADDDIYAADNAGDKVFELVNQGFDIVVASANFVLQAGSHVEELHAAADGNINLTGNELANALVGNVGNNLLDGGRGADRMEGGAGNDIYLVDNRGDQVVEAPVAGNDTIRTTISYVLGNAILVETLEAIGAAGVNLTGNFFDNQLIGNAAANVLDGSVGADSMRGGAGNDTYLADSARDLVDELSHGGAGIDTVRSTVNFNLAGTQARGAVENLTLVGNMAINGTGNALNNVIIGNARANTLDGNTGADTMRGGAGNDTYVVDNARDLVDELNGGAGIDTVKSSISFSLAGAQVQGAVENLVLIGSKAINGTGNALDNVIVGNAMANIIGGAAGNDRLTGGGGNDFFDFSTKLNALANVDTIVDFNVPQDTVRLNHTIFTGLVAGRTLAAGAFFVGAAAHDASDRIIYNSANGQLFFDSNGNAAGGATHFATLAPHLALTNADFFVV